MVSKERLMELRKTLTHACDLHEHDQEWIDIIDRLAAIERQVRDMLDEMDGWNMNPGELKDAVDARLRAIIDLPDHP